MANDQIALSNFYRRYLWNEDDFGQFQDGMVDVTRGVSEGTFGAAVLEGFAASAQGNMSILLSTGIAVGPTGYLHVINSVSTLQFATPATNPVRSLVVARPSLVDADYITSPTEPTEQVPLRTLQESVALVIAGVEANSPSYPSTVAGDVVLFGVRTYPGQTSIALTDLDFEVRDSLGKNSKFQQNQALYDDRARPYRITNHSMGVKPAQTQIGNDPKTFLYINKGTPSRFPLSVASEFVYGNTYVNFQTGAITGSDAQSPDFTPTIPTAGASIVATLSLRSNDTLNVTYGTQGTRAQCFAAIQNASTVGAGAIALPADMMRLAFVVLYSNDGVNITELDFVDGRSTLYFGGPASSKNYPSVFLSALGNGDATTLAAAVALLPASGGTILVMDAVTVPDVVSIPTNTNVVGRGPGESSLLIAGASGLNVADQCTIRDLAVSCTGNAKCIILSGGASSVERCKFSPPSGSSAKCITIPGEGNHIRECTFSGVVTPGTASGIVYELGSADNSDSWNIFQN
jgi:hypothetical protein